MLQAFFDWQLRRIRLMPDVRVQPKPVQTVEKPRRVADPNQPLQSRKGREYRWRKISGKHGTTYGYNLRCRCLRCRMARATYEREWRAQVRAQASV